MTNYRNLEKKQELQASWKEESLLLTAGFKGQVRAVCIICSGLHENGTQIENPGERQWKTGRQTKETQHIQITKPSANKIDNTRGTNTEQNRQQKAKQGQVKLYRTITRERKRDEARKLHNMTHEEDAYKIKQETIKLNPNIMTKQGLWNLRFYCEGPPDPHCGFEILPVFDMWRLAGLCAKLS